MKGKIRLDEWGRVELIFSKPIFDTRVMGFISVVTYEDTAQAIKELGEEPIRKLIEDEADEVEVEFDPSVVLYGGDAV